MSPTLSVLIPTKARVSLMATLESIRAQASAGDEVIVDFNRDGDWGHAARNRMMPRAKGDFLLFIDDDDVYVPGALARIREACADEPRALHVFRMVYPDGEVLWRDESIENNVSTGMIAAPNIPSVLGRWGDRYAGDADFIASTLELMGSEPVFHPEVIVGVGHNRLERGV